MVYIFFFVVGNRPLSIIFDLLCLIKLMLCLVDLRTYLFLSNFAFYLGVTIRICSFFMFSQCFKQNLQLSCFVVLIISYPTHCFTFGIIFVYVQVLGLED